MVVIFGCSCQINTLHFQVFPTYHMYPQTAPHVAYMQPKANAPSFFMADELRQVIRIFRVVHCCLEVQVYSFVLTKNLFIFTLVVGAD